MGETTELPAELRQRLEGARLASQTLRAAPTATKNTVLSEAARLLVVRSADILRANAEDLAALSSDVTDAFRDRLRLDPARIVQMIESLRQVAALPDPV